MKFAFFDSMENGTSFYYRHIQYIKTSKNKAKGILSGKKIDIPAGAVCFPTYFQDKLINGRKSTKK